MYGDKCKFSHQQKGQYDTKSETISRASSLQDDLRAWRLLLPTSNKNIRPLGHRISHFFQQAFRLINGEPAIMQETVESLSSEGGLARIKELTEVQLGKCSEEQLATVFSNDFLHFFRTITSPDILASHVLEKHVVTIYNYLYGPGGNRALGLYRHLARMFKYMSDDALPDQVLEKLQPDFATCLGVTVAVLAKMVDTNGTASLNEEFHPVIETLAGILGHIEKDGKAHSTLLRTHQQILRIRQRLGLGQAMAISAPLVRRRGKMPSFKVSIDGPGWLSKDGCRHRNDFEDISEIRILPTSDEIRSHRQEYLPVTDPAQLHLGGIEGVLDRNFRLLREDTIGQLRNAIRLELDHPSDAKELRQSIRTYPYQNMRCSTIEMDQRKGLRFLVSFDQPAALRKLNKSADRERQEWWGSSKRLQAESIVCILNSEEAVIFCTVVGLFELENQNTFQEGPKRVEGDESTSKGLQRLLACDQGEGHGGSSASLNFRGQRDRAYAVLRLVETDEHNIRQLLDLSQAHTPQARNSLIEFPGVLLPAFLPTLEALQKMSATLDLPFADMLAPSWTSTLGQIRIPPPIYTTNRNFRFDLSCIVNEAKPMTLSTREQFDLDDFRQNTSLDYARASAVIDALTRSVALIQGPPGTGKSFTGIALTKVLLENAKSGDIGPVICVCYTNHALDQLLEQLLEHGIEQIIRIGSQSKSELLQPLNLWKVLKTVDRTQMEKVRRAELATSLARDAEHIQGLLEELRQAGSVASIEGYLEVNYPDQYRQLFSNEDDERFTFVYRKENAIDDWLGARHPRTTGLGESASVTRSIAELLTADIHYMSLIERHNLHRYWRSGIVEDLRNQLTRSLLDYHDSREEYEHVQDDLKLRCLKQANVIGLTTTGLAKKMSLFRRLHSKVLICEEAGEVLEAHLLTALLPSIEQAIFIGDPQQLRPQIQNYELSRENYEVMSDRDGQDLDASGLEEPLLQHRSGIARTTLLNAVRIATVDNFQGEEAKVVVISLVRSNPQNRCPSVCGEQYPDAKYCHVCASDNIKETQVDYILAQTYKDVNPDEDPIIFPQCGHFITLFNLDGQMDMARYYTMDAGGLPNGLRGESEPLSESDPRVKSCPQCRGSLRNLSRYGRIVRRALLDEATKKFIVAASREYVPLAKKSTRYQPALSLREAIRKHLDSVRIEEQPFRRVWDMVQTARRLHGTAQGSFEFSSSVLHTTSELRATALLFRCDITILSDFVKQQQRLVSGEAQGELSINLVCNRWDCVAMIEAAEAAGDKLRQMEGHFFFASFVAIERMVRGKETGELKERALEHIKTAEAIPGESAAGNFQGVLAELEEVKRALNEGTFYSVVQGEEWRAVVSAMSQEFSTTGHWYRCLNGHPFTVGECGRPMESTRCPECAAPVGGQHHQAAEGVEQMHGLEQQFGVMGIQ
ncbi:MAG: hypothetical protein Q9165_003607 [Trypethelium subeluteriae]